MVTTSIQRWCSLTHPHLLEGRPKRKKNGCLLPTMKWRKLHREKECHDARPFTTQEEEKDTKAEGVTSECLQHDEWQKINLKWWLTYSGDSLKRFVARAQVPWALCWCPSFIPPTHVLYTLICNSPTTTRILNCRFQYSSPSPRGISLSCLLLLAVRTHNITHTMIRHTLISRLDGQAMHVRLWSFNVYWYYDRSNLSGFGWWWRGVFSCWAFWEPHY